MSPSMSCMEANAKGCAAFRKGEFSDAIIHFSEAIIIAPTNPVFYYNRAGAYIALGNSQKDSIVDIPLSVNTFTLAISDARKTVEMRPDFFKAYCRLATAFGSSYNYDGCIEACRKGLELDPGNHKLHACLSSAEAGKAFWSEEPYCFGTEMWAKLDSNPLVKIFMGDSDYVQALKLLQTNPPFVDCYKNYHPIVCALKLLLKTDRQKRRASAVAQEDLYPPLKRIKGESEISEEEMDLPKFVGGEANERVGYVEALDENQKGVAAYKTKDFVMAVQHFKKAIELDVTQISFMTNLAAAYMELGMYEDCIKTCDTAVERGRNFKSDYKMVAKALTRKGTALVKMAELSYEAAIEAFQNALTEQQNPHTLKKLNDAEKAKKSLEQQEYYDP